MPDSSFQTAFADLAHASMAEKVPMLMEHLVGFQVIDKSDDDTRAVGVFGFKVGNQWFYAPVFFLNGALKGLELLYVKNQDLFVPLQDNWVNYLLSKQPPRLGETESLPENKLNINQPDFRVFSEPPGTSGTKWASVINHNRVKDWAKPFLPAYQSLVAGFHKGASHRLDLAEVIKREPALSMIIAQTMKADPKFAEAALTFYDIHELLPPVEVVKKAAFESKFTPGENQLSGKGKKIKTPQQPDRAPLLATSATDMPNASALSPNANGLGGPPKQNGASGGPAAANSGKVTVASFGKEAELVGDNHKWGYAKKYDTTEDVIKSICWRGKTEKQAEAAPKTDAEQDHKITSENDDSQVDAEQYIARDKKSPKVQVFSQEDSPSIMTDLTDAEKEKLRKGEIVVKDHRDNTSHVYDAEYERKLENPIETGIYGVLTSNRGFTRCLVIQDPKTIGKGRSAGVSTIVSLEGKEYGTFRNIDVWVAKADNKDKEPTERFGEVFKKAKSLDSMKAGYMYVLVGNSGSNAVFSVPFKYLKNSTSTDGTSTYYVKPDTQVESARSQVRRTLDNRWDHKQTGIFLDDLNNGPCNVGCCSQGDDEKKKPYSSWELSEARQILSSDRAQVTTLKNVGATSIVPETFKVIELGASPSNSLAKDDEKTVRMDPGTLSDAEMYILKLGAAPLVVHKDLNDYFLRSEQGQMRLTKIAALKTLVTGWGMKLDDAEAIVKEAKYTPREYFVKLAGGLDTPPTAPYAPPYMSGYNQQIGVPIQQQQTDFMPVMGMQPKAENRNVYTLMDKQPLYQAAIDAGQKGQKDVFDTAVIGGLVKTVDVDRMTDSFLPDMIKGMDRTGRSLFLFYWHNDKFRERYGRQDLMELEDSLRNVLKSTGDLIIFLKQKTIESDPAFSSMDLTLDSPEQ